MRDRWDDSHQEIEAVSSGAKSMSFLSLGADALEYEEILELFDVALGYGLQASIQEVSSPGQPKWRRVYFYRPGQSWRVQAFGALCDIAGEYGWSDGLEALNSRLLGYSEEHLSAWLEWFHRQKVGWSGITVYVLLSKEQQGRLARLGMRCLDPSAVGADTLLFWQLDVVPRLDIDDRIPSELALGRMALSYEMCVELFGQLAECQDRVGSRLLDEALAIKVNQSLRSKIEFRTEGTWR